MGTASKNFCKTALTCGQNIATPGNAGHEMVATRRKEEIIKEAGRIEMASFYSSEGHFAAAAFWRGLCLCLGLPATILAAVAAASAFSQFDIHHAVGGSISAIVAVLSALTTFLNPNSKATAHFVAGNKYIELRDKARIFQMIDCWGGNSDDLLAKNLKELAEEKNELNKKSPQIPWLGYAIARRTIASRQ